MKSMNTVLKRMVAFLCVAAIIISCSPYAMAEEAENFTRRESLYSVEEAKQAEKSVAVEKVYKEESSVSHLSHEEAKERQEKLEQQKEVSEISLFADNENEYSEIVYIYNVADLYDIDGHVGGYYEFKNNISISDIDWKPIHLHNATINGNGHRVNMKINGTAKAGQYVALFSGSDNYLTDLRLDLDLDLTVNGGMVKPLGDVYAHNCTIIGDMNVYVKTRYYSQDDPSIVRHLFTDAVYGIDSGSSNRYIGNITVSGDYEETNEIKPGSFDVYILTNCIDSIFEGNIYVEMCPKYLFKRYSGWISQAKLYGITKSKNCHLLGNIYVSADSYSIYDSEECSIVGNITADLFGRLKFNSVGNSPYLSYNSVYGISDSKNSYIAGDINITGDDAYHDGREMYTHIFRGIYSSENCYITGNITGTKVGLVGILGNNCSITGNINIFNVYRQTVYCAIDGNYNSLYGNIYCELGKGEDYRCSVTGSRGYNNTIIGSFTVKHLASGITTSVPEGTVPTYFCYPCSNGLGHVTHGEGLTYQGGYPACEVCYAKVEKMAKFTYEDHPYETEEYVEPNPVIPISFSIQVVNAISGLPIEGAEVSADSSTESTDRNGIATFKQDCHIGGLYIQKNGKILHTENDYIAHKGINIIRVTDVHIDKDSFNFGNNASETITGAEIEIAGKKLPVINQSMEFNMDLFEAVSVAYNPSDNTLEVLMDLEKIHAEDALKKEWVEKYSEFSDVFDEAINGTLDPDKMHRYNVSTGSKGNAGKLRKKFGIDGDITAFGFLKLKLDEDISILEGGVTIAGSLEKKGTLPVPSAPWIYFAYGLEGSLAAGVEAKLINSSYNTPEFNINGLATFGLEPQIGTGFGFKDFLAVEVGVEGELGAKAEFPFKSFPESFSSELSASVYSLINTLGFEKKGSWEFANIQIYPRKKSLMLMSIASQDELKIVERNYNNGIELMSQEDGVIKSGLYPYTAIKLADMGSGKKLMVWLDDDVERDLYNKTALYYSFYDGAKWSEPQHVYDDETADFEFELKTAGSKAILVWQNINSKLTEEDTVTTTAKKSELCYMEFYYNGWLGTTSWSEPVSITTDNTVYEYNPDIITDNYSNTVVWKSNETNNVFAEFDALPENVHTKELSSDETSTVFEDKIVYDLLCGENNIAVITDSDDKSETIGTWLYINGTVVHQSDHLISGLSYSNGKFYFHENGSIMRIAIDGTEAEVFAENVNASARVVNDTTVISELVDGFKSELYVSYLVGEKWSAPMQLTDFGGRIRSWKCSLDTLGNISVAAAVADVNKEGENISQSVRLMYKDTAPIADIVLTDVYAKNVTRGETATVYIGITNNTKELINTFYTEIKAGENILYYGDITISGLSASETGYAEVGVNIPMDFEKQEITITISAHNIEESNQKNNSKTDIWGYSDLEVSLDGKFIKSEGIATAVVTNKGCETASNTLITLENDKGEIIYNRKTDEIAPGKSITLDIEIPEAYRTLAAGTNRIVYTAKVSGNSEETVEWNNKASYVFENKADKIVSLDTTEVILRIGESYMPEVTIFPSGSHAELYMVSADEDVVTVDESGTVTAVGEGIATVSYYTQDTVVPSLLTVIVRDTLGELKIVEEYEKYNRLYLTVDTTGALFPGETANLFVAAYDAVGKLCSIEIYDDVKYSKQVEVEADYFDSMVLKMFLWSTTRSMTPVATSLCYFKK